MPTHIIPSASSNSVSTVSCRQAVRIRGITAVPNELRALTVELQQAPVHRAQPEHSVAVFIELGHSGEALRARTLPRERSSA